MGGSGPLGVPIQGSGWGFTPVQQEVGFCPVVQTTPVLPISAPVIPPPVTVKVAPLGNVTQNHAKLFAAKAPVIQKSEDDGKNLAGLITQYHAAVDPAQKAETSQQIAIVAKALGDEGTFNQYASLAVMDAHSMPNGVLLAAPLMEADLLAVDGQYLAASDRYRTATVALREGAKRSPEVAEELARVNQRHKATLTAAVLTHTAACQAQLNDHDRSDAMAAADRLYLLEPTEENIEKVYLTYAAVGLDIRELRQRIAANEAVILDAPNILSDLLQSPKGTTSGEPDFLKQSQTFSRETGVKFAQSQNELWKPIVRGLEDRLLGLVTTAHQGSNFDQNIQFSRVQLLMGDKSLARIHLDVARQIFQRGDVPHTAMNLMNQVTVLHRLVSLSDRHFVEELDTLGEAQGLIDELILQDKNQGALLKAENLELKADVSETVLKAQLARGDLEPDAYQALIRKNYQDIADHCSAILPTLQDQKTRGEVAGRLMAATATLLEHDLGEAQVKHLAGDQDEARFAAAFADMRYESQAKVYGTLLSPEKLAEVKGRAELARAYYDFKTGKIESAIARLRTVAGRFPDSTAARVIKQSGSWPHKYGIVDEQGAFSQELNEPSFMEGLKVAVSKLTEQQGRGLVACTVGGAVYAGLDIAFGEKVTGAGVIAACTGAYLVDRAMVVAEASDEIASAYRAGVANVTTEEAVASAGLFLFELGTMYLGGAVGGTLQKGALAAGSYGSRKLTSFLVSRGVKPGPWTRRLVGFTVREGGYVANAYGFHQTTELVHDGLSAIQDPNAPKPKKDEAGDLFVSWLFVRVFPLIEKANPGAALIKGKSAADLMAQKAISRGIAATVVQTGSSAVKDGFGHFGDKVASSLINLYMMGKGNEHVMKRLFPLEAVNRLNGMLDEVTIRNIKAEQEVLARTERPDWCGNQPKKKASEPKPGPDSPLSPSFWTRVLLSPVAPFIGVMGAFSVMEGNSGGGARVHPERKIRNRLFQARTWRNHKSETDLGSPRFIDKSSEPIDLDYFLRNSEELLGRKPEEGEDIVIIYAMDQTGEIRVGEPLPFVVHHSSLFGPKESVVAAGEMEIVFRDNGFGKLVGQVRKIDAVSGHFQPVPEVTLPLVEFVLRTRETPMTPDFDIDTRIQ